MPPPGTFGPERIDRSTQGSLLPGGGMPPPYIFLNLITSGTFRVLFFGALFSKVDKKVDTARQIALPNVPPVVIWEVGIVII